MAKRQTKALFIEDSEVDMELVALQLQREGFDIQWFYAQSETQLKKCLKSVQPDFILSDYTMPGFNGLAALHLVREMDKEIPFIFVSGTIGEERAIESMREGATDYVLKDNLRRLGTAINRALKEAGNLKQFAAAEANSSRLARTLEITTDFVAIYTGDLRLKYLNAAGRRLLGMADEERIEDMDISEFHPEWAQKLLQGAIRDALESDGIWGGDGAVLSRQGEEIPLSKVTIAHKKPDGEVEYVSTIGRDIRERKAFEAQISYLANYDSLTGLPNRNLLSDRLDQAMARSRRHGGAVAVLIADIDRFKVINAGLGHAAGDQLLDLVGKRLCGIVRDSDTVARLGADTFAILAADMNNVGDIRQIMNKVWAGTKEPFPVKGKQAHITMSVGASLYARDGNNFEQLVRNAEAAMNRAKAAGGDGFEYYTEELTRQAIERMELESALRRALGSDELELHFQPQLSLETSEVIGAEALMRWHRAGQEWISPGRFIPVAEDSDLILSLDEFALRSACQHIQRWSGVEARPFRLALNVSGRQFRSKTFEKMVARIVQSAGIDPSRLELELTEGYLIEDKDRGMKKLSRLKDLGLTISLDDFGTGYSNLGYLSRLPIDRLKIDQTFVQRLFFDPNNAEIIRAIISLAHSLDMVVIAEGIETAEHLAFLRRHGCEEGQGYLFSRAVPADDFLPVLRGRRVPGWNDDQVTPRRPNGAE